MRVCYLCKGDLGRECESHYNCRNAWKIYLGNLAQNLVVVGAMQEAYDRGYTHGARMF